MIVWCAWCQRLIGEVEPWSDLQMSHGVCARCGADHLDGNERPIRVDDAAMSYFRQLFSAARRGDRESCRELAGRGVESGYRPVDLLVGMVQPALEEIGRRWERGEVTVSDEHRFTAWCEAVVSFLEGPPAPAGPLDILLVPAPGNRHEIGCRIAEQVFVAAGLGALAVWPELPEDELAGLLDRHRPAWLGLSCATADDLRAAGALADRMRERGFGGRVLLSGQAVRRSPGARIVRGIEACPTAAGAVELVRGSSAG